MSLPNAVSEKKKQPVCKFSSAGYNLIDPLLVKGRVPGKGRINFCLLKTNPETQVITCWKAFPYISENYKYNPIQLLC